MNLRPYEISTRISLSGNRVRRGARYGVLHRTTLHYYPPLAFTLHELPSMSHEPYPLVSLRRRLRHLNGEEVDPEGPADGVPHRHAVVDEQDNRRPQHPALGNKTVFRVRNERHDEHVDRQNVEPARFVGHGERQL